MRGDTQTGVGAIAVPRHAVEFHVASKVRRMHPGLHSYLRARVAASDSHRHHHADQGGIETIMEIRSRDPVIPIIAISGGGRIHNSDFLEMARMLGANDSLTKPFTPQELVAVVRRLRPVEDGAPEPSAP
jgi:DNA-binding NtrC family response regulator